MYRVLFVCTGNTCRSPMAEAILRKKLTEQGLEQIQVQSAGVAAAAETPASKGAMAALNNRQIDAFGHKSRLFIQETGNWADLILTMTQSHKHFLLAQFPDMRDKVYTLKEYVSETGEAGVPNYDIADPFGGSLDVYEACAEELEQAIDALIIRLDEFHEESEQNG